MDSIMNAKNNFAVIYSLVILFYHVQMQALGWANAVDRPLQFRWPWLGPLVGYVTADP